MSVLRHWLEADEKPRCQHCPALADERSFMCEDCAGKADGEVQTLRDALERIASAKPPWVYDGDGTQWSPFTFARRALDNIRKR